MAPFAAAEPFAVAAAGTAAVDAAPSGVAEAAQRAAGTAVAALEPSADAEAVQPAAGTAAAGLAAEVVAQPQALAQLSVSGAFPDGRVWLPARKARLFPAARTATRNRVFHRASGRIARDAHLEAVHFEDAHPDPAAVRLRQEPARYSATDARPVGAVHPVLHLESAPAAHCPAEDCPAGRRRVADPAPVVPAPALPDGRHRRQPEERPEAELPCPDGSGSPCAWPTAARPARTRDGLSPHRPVRHQAAPA